MAAVTRARNSGLTNVLSLTTADTVAVETPAAFATSLIVAKPTLSEPISRCKLAEVDSEVQPLCTQGSCHAPLFGKRWRND